MRLLTRPAAACEQIRVARCRAPSSPSSRCLSTAAWKARARSADPVPPRTLSKSPGSNLKLKSDAKPASRSRVDWVRLGHDPKTRLRRDASDKYTGRHALFRSTVLLRFQHVLAQLASSEFSVAGVGKDELNQQAALFMNSLDDAFMLAEQNITRRDKNPLFWALRDAFILRDIKGLTQEVRFSFQSFLVRSRFSRGLEESQKQLLDFRFPQEWFPATRAVQRTIHLHVGPTNSGKTYHALRALEKSKCGVYAGPLRLLATEVYQRLTVKGFPCGLITGEEVRLPKDTDSYFTSCTVEMVPLNQPIDVAVIDEIQMIADPDRGYAWTQALLGMQAKELHVCGEERAVKLVQSLCASVGDECIVHRYERLSPLQTMNTAIDGDYDSLEKGDAIVAFSRLSLHALKRSIETRTGRRCAIIYGSLPPEVRVQQAALFNDPNNDYDFVVASDAIGMGLNLEIHRVILESVNKYDGNQNRLLTFPEIKQIGGRAGRFRTAQQAAEPVATGGDEQGHSPVEEQRVGRVTTMDKADLRSISLAFRTQPDDISTAVIQPPPGITERFATYFPPDTPMSFILMRMKMEATVGKRYQLSIPSVLLEISDIIQDIPLTVADRLVFTHCPVSLRAERGVDVLRALARAVATNTNGDLLSIKEIPLEFLDLDLADFKGRGADFLSKLEALHVAINQYAWLSYRYTGIFRSQKLAFHVRSLVEQRLIETLDRLDFTEEQLQQRRQTKRRMTQSSFRSKSVVGKSSQRAISKSNQDDLDRLEDRGAAIDEETITNGKETVEWREAAQASPAGTS